MHIHFLHSQVAIGIPIGTKAFHRFHCHGNYAKLLRDQRRKKISGECLTIFLSIWKRIRTHFHQTYPWNTGWERDSQSVIFTILCSKVTSKALKMFHSGNNGESTICRCIHCISYWKRWMFQLAMLVYWKVNLERSRWRAKSRLRVRVGDPKHWNHLWCTKICWYISFSRKESAKKPHYKEQWVDDILCFFSRRENILIWYIDVVIYWHSDIVM